jgi:nucleotide-binding universal stress UspA family protein
MITIKSIPCPVDFFAASDAAVSYAVGLAGNYGAGIHLLHVITPVPVTAYQYAVDATPIMKSMEETAEAELVKLAARVKEAGITVDFEISAGDVCDEIKPRYIPLHIRTPLSSAG